MMVPHFTDFPMAATTTSIAPIPTVIPGVPLVQELHDVGKRTLWVVTVLMGISSLVFYSLGARAPLTKRVFHTLSALITTISFFSYLALATGQGMAWKQSHVTERHKHVPNTEEDYLRQILWLRYVNWALATPLLLINLALVSGLPGANLVVAIAGLWGMLAAGLLGSFAGHTPARWAWLILSCISYLVMLHHGVFHAQRAARNKDAQTRRFFTAISGSGFIILALFPISLAAGPLALKISVDVETVLFAVQDIFTQGLLGYWLLLAHDSSPGITLHLDGFWSQGVGNEGAIRIPEEEGA
ncbi:Rhodopsin archaeal/bacterial/fungal [Penicillium capsulatum]|uniref:Rhodopsin archaeal/bacterial/fungal n=1 Tax=Penicillium capsulatum TaxID=69766 RepID=A0A9W9ILV5_9EURO|nr:Rhodopsin archaeal/bacterial/fungal [Penicillium capsulatum]KAJ6121299.1 Rhodopsin archaeal/bacterial/fungal [Penicillium capsulatum]